MLAAITPSARDWPSAVGVMEASRSAWPRSPRAHKTRTTSMTASALITRFGTLAMVFLGESEIADRCQDSGRRGQQPMPPSRASVTHLNRPEDRTKLTSGPVERTARSSR
jgi:hypothetical protein